mgnify:CR=1 FL=1
MPNIFGLILTCVIVVIVFSLLLFLIKRYKKCPSDKVMVIYGKVGSNKDGSTRSAKCIHGGAAFIWPVIQSYEFLDLTPMSISVDLENALSRQNIRINVPSRFTVGVSTEPGVMQNAAERLLGLKLQEIQELAKDIIFGQLRLVIATMDIEEINTDRDKFLEAVSRNVEGELKKIGLRLINVNVTDISDESGYIDALGKEAAAKAINDAKKNVAEKDRDGSIGEAQARRDQHPGGPGRRLRHPGRELLQGGGGHVQRPAPREGGRGHPHRHRRREDRRSPGPGGGLRRRAEGRGCPRPA